MKLLWLRPSKGDNISVRRERIAEELRKKGYEVDIRDASGTDAVGAIKQAITGDYDVIAGNVRIGLYIGYPLARLLRTPFLGDVSDPITDIDYLPKPLFRFFEWYEWQVLSRADTTVFVYESTYQEALERGISDGRKLPNAVEYEFFADPDPDAVSEAEEILRGEGVDLDRPIAVYIGVFSPRYRVEDIIGAAKEATEWEFVFLGEGELETELREASEAIENVHYPGAFPYRLMPGFLSHADVGFCFKDAEQPLKLKEYGAAGLPIIARPGELQRFHDGSELLFVEPDAEGIAALLDDIEKGRIPVEEYTDAGREIASEWSWKEIADGYDQLLKQIS